MPTMLILILATILTAVFSLTGGVLFLGKNKIAKKVQNFGPIVAIVVLGYAVFGDIIPDILEDGLAPLTMVVLIITGFMVCGVFGVLLGHFHHHSSIQTGKSKTELKNHTEAITMLMVDSVHNIADGIVIGVSFIAGIGTGITTCLATLAHEIPQEVGDFSIMQKSKMPRGKIIKLQLASGLLSAPAAIVAFLVGDQLTEWLPNVLSVVAGFLLYIAVSELIYVCKLFTDRGQRDIIKHK